jgi:hypothetical protein
MSKPPTKAQIQSYFASIELKREPVTTITTPPFLPSFDALFLEILMAHTIRIDKRTGEYLLHFPEGTSKTEILPRTLDERYRIVLPDGFELQEVRHRGATYSYLTCAAAVLTPEQQCRMKSVSEPYR